MGSIGKTIKAKVEQQGRSVHWLAEKLSCHRSNIYDIFQRDNIDLALLIRISRILQYNFLKEPSNELDRDIAAEECPKI